MATSQILVRIPNYPNQSLHLNVPNDITVFELTKKVYQKLYGQEPIGHSREQIRITTLGGLELGATNNDNTQNDLVFEDLSEGKCEFKQVLLHHKVLGGKGGFGSMLRSQGGKMSSKKITNFDSCRDLTGKRLKTTKAADAVADILEKEEEEKELIREKRRKKIEKGLKERPAKKHFFDDNEYLKDSQEIAESTKKATKKAMKDLLKKSKKGKEIDAKVPDITKNDGSARNSNSPTTSSNGGSGSPKAFDLGIPDLPSDISSDESDEDVSETIELDNKAFEKNAKRLEPENDNDEDKVASKSQPKKKARSTKRK
ncbi:hypothetical protein H4219_003558 [Mycoemilia scoparia]|uniref:SDE2-like domain-containing protein n=1 Tax=Mycoemilia scoparia TaxID=417184 RepID=A0A9W8A064_9FUNG|nr:hypothetical protein H4219_003558 [Mycoemilia scoparia]